MANNVNSVNIKTKGKKSYHHGDLKSSLILAGLELIESHGVEQFSLRRVARQAGVSPAAPANHFVDVRGLLTAIATVGFLRLSQALQEAADGDWKNAVRAQCHAYLKFALAHPGLFRLMWRREVLDATNKEYLLAASTMFENSDQLVRPNQPKAKSRDPAFGANSCVLGDGTWSLWLGD